MTERPALRTFATVPAIAVPDRIFRLPRDPRGYPVPYFVNRPPGWKDGEPIDFRIVLDPARLVQAVRSSTCWVCGGRLGGHKAFVGGVLSAAQAIYSDPPSHRECAEFAAKACPFLAIPTAVRRNANMPAHVNIADQHHVLDNPEVTGVVIAKGVRIMQSVLKAEDVREIIWYAQGRLAHRDEVVKAIAVARNRDELRAFTARPILAKLDALEKACLA